MKVLTLLVCVVAGIVQAQSQPYKGLPRDVLSSQYFPPGVFDTSMPSSSGAWYASTLNALGEPSLFVLRDNKSTEVYRFLWLPSFHRPISIRLTVNADGSGSIVTRSVDRHAGLLTKPASDTGKLIADTTNAVNKEQVRDVLGRLQRLAFWSMPTEEEQAMPQASGTNPGAVRLRVAGSDGAQWVLEGVRGGAYHVVDRWSPKDDSFSQLCKYLLRLGKVEVTLY